MQKSNLVKWKKALGGSIMLWLSNSPDITLIFNIWSIVKSNQTSVIDPFFTRQR
ncbi:hypothetical protein CLU79DRAFT_733223 [Phycomyces nitens]|nr:hypothetical protein CLU79DRAFT_733223 [Phycomyces nitens]